MSTLRSRIDARFELLGHWVFRHRFLTLGLMVLLAVAFCSQLFKLTFDTSNESYFRKDDPTIQAYDDFRAQFGREEFIILAVTPPEVFEGEFLAKLAEFHDALEREVPYLDDVTSLINVRDTRGQGDELIVEDLLETIPGTPEAMAALRERVLNHPLYRNFLVSPDGQMTAVVIETLAYSPGEAVEEDLLESFDDGGAAGAGMEPGAAAERIPLTVEENRAVVNAVRAVTERFEGPDFPVHTAGGPPLNDFFERMMQQDMGLFMVATLPVIAVFLFVLFRRISGVLLPLAVVFLSLLSTVGLMAATGVSFTIPTTILPSFLLAVGVGASVHLLAVFYRNYQETRDKESAVVHALGHSGLPIVMTSLTTAAGLFAFSTAEMAPVAHLGIFAGSGVMIALVYTVLLLPALLAIFPVTAVPHLGGNGPTKLIDGLLGAIADFSTRRATWIVLGSAGIVTASIIGLFSLQFSMYFIKWLPESLPLRSATDLIDRELGGTINLEVVIDTGVENGLYEPDVMNGLQELATYAENYRNAQGERFVAKTNSVADVLKETHKALNENREAFYRLPDNRQLIAQELLLFENSGSDDLEQLVDSQFSMARLTVVVPNRDAAAYVEFVGQVEQEAARIFADHAQITVTGTLNLFAQLIFVMMRSMAESYLIAGVVITILMMLLIGSFRLGLVSMVINFSPILLTLGIVMGFNGIRLDAFTLTIGSIALGLAVDDTIHFFHNFRRYFGETGSVEEAVRRTMLTAGRAMLFTTLVLVTGFWMFMLATLNNVVEFGLLTGFTILFALAADFLLAPALLVLITRTQAGRAITQRWSGSAA